MRKRVLFSCLFSLPAIAFAQFNGYDRFLSFEELDKSVGVTGGDISVSGAHYKDGKASLRWAFNPGDTLYIRRDFSQTLFYHLNLLFLSIADSRFQWNIRSQFGVF